MNNGNENRANPGLNDRSYHSADNGFACAAAGRGVTEALQEHLNVIARNEELEIERSHSQIQADINHLVEDKERLEQRKLDLQDSIKTLTEERAVKEVKISELTTELDAPIKDDSPPTDPRIEMLNTAIEEKTLALEEKQVARVKIETDLEAPTKDELDPPAVDKAPASRFSALDKGFAGLTAFVLLGLIAYLFIFYASVGDRAFTEGVGTTQEKEHVIVPDALFKALESNKAFVLLFPLPFLMLAFLYCFYDELLENKLKKWGVLGATFIIDLIIAVKIAQNIHYAKTEENIGVGPAFSNYGLEIISVLFLGFGVSVLLGFGLSCVRNVWNRGKQPQDESERLEKLKRAEQNGRLIQLACLTKEIQHLQNRIDGLKQERENCEKDVEDASKQRLDALIEAHKHPIQVEIARLNTEQETLQNQIIELNEQVESIQKEINQCESEIEDLLNDQRKKVIDVKKLEAQAHEFVSGWCKYVTQSRTELPADVATQIKNIQDLKHETLEAYKNSLATA